MITKRSLRYTGAALLIVLAVVGSWLLVRSQRLQFQGLVLESPRSAPDFTLTGQTGKSFHFSAQHADATLMFFGYTFCPDVCPGTMAEFRQAIKLLGSDAKRVQFIFVSVDPERDTPARLQEYLSRFDPAIIGLTGSEQVVAEVVKAYGIVAEKKAFAGSSAGYLVSHTAASFLIDPTGHVRVKFPFGTDPQVLANDVRVVLAERARR